MAKQSILSRFLKAYFKETVGDLIQDDDLSKRGQKSLHRLFTEMEKSGQTFSYQDSIAVDCYSDLAGYAGLFLTQYGAMAMQILFRTSDIAHLIHEIKAAEMCHNQYIQRPIRRSEIVDPDTRDFLSLDADAIGDRDSRRQLMAAIQYNDTEARAMYSGVVDDLYTHAPNPLADAINSTVESDNIAANYSNLIEARYGELRYAIQASMRFTGESNGGLYRMNFFTRALAKHVKVPEVAEILAPVGPERDAVIYGINEANAALDELATLPIVRFSAPTSPGETPIEAGKRYTEQLKAKINELITDSATGERIKYELFTPAPEKAVNQAARHMEPRDVVSMSAIFAFIRQYLPNNRR